MLNNIDVTDHWIKDVKYGEIRGRIIVELLDLMDKDYQMTKWPINIGGYGIDTYIGFSIEMFFDELDLAQNVIQSKPPFEDIGEIYKNKEEAISLLKVCSILRPLWRTSVTDDEFLSSPLLSEMRIEAKNCFEVFMDNEKDNKDFCAFVLKIIIQDHKYIPDTNKSNYENIVLFAKSVI